MTNSFFGSEVSSEVCPGAPPSSLMESSQGSVHLRAQEPTSNSGQVVTFTCQRSQPVATRRVRLLSPAALDVDDDAIHVSGHRDIK